MADDGERFGLSLNGFRVRTPLALASMGGVVDSAYTLARAAHTLS